ncbi:sugar ABC transporter substrate-binding protein [uncultured Sphaerochaeta sp.]|uniref:ABC transporter substrate-binding protein n=1 Tax=uncultured Sphaerochaeta sp. TaxID=886478 RepID=UPI002A0A5CE4|nr:sugar ABC transporter substrate-binding protein [uncultured Sphaerochaeta sp.]
MKKRFIVVLLVAVVACSFAFANGQKEKDSQVAATQKGGLTMKFWIFLDPNSTEDPRSVVLKDIVDEYNMKNQFGNKVEVESIHWSKFESQVIQAAASGTGPDIINAFSDQLRLHIGAGTVQPMTDFAIPFIASMPDYIHSAAKLTQGDGEIYSLPWESRATVLWYRSDIFPKAPTSWDDLKTMGSAAADKNGLGFAIALGEGSNGTGLMETFIPWIRSAGGDLLDSNGKAIFNSEAGVKVLEYIKSLIQAGSMNNTTMSMVYDDLVDGYKSGTIYAGDIGTQRSSTIRTSSLVDKFASAPIPGMTSSAPAPAYVAGQTLAIGKFAQDPEMAFDFIKYFYTTENQTKWVKANILPVRTSVYDDPEIKAMPMYDSMQMWSNYAKTGSIVFFPADYSELSSKLAQAVQKVVFKGADAKQQLDEVASWYNSKSH